MTHDPITFSVILSRFDAIATEMTKVLERSAWSSNLALAHDYSCAIYDAVPRQVSMFDALPIHSTSMNLVVKEIADRFEGSIAEGDVYMCNDPFRNNTHIGDLVTAAPVFSDGRLVFWSVTKGHQLDTGAFVASSVTASAQNVWQEGLTIPPCRLVERGEMRQDLLDVFLANVRFQDLVEGDVRSMLGSIERGRQRLVELCDEYGTATVLRYVDEMIGYADRRMSQEIQAMPDGVYRAEGWVDSDGFEAEHIPVKVAVTIAGERVTVDYTGSGPQGRGGTNGTFATAMAAGTIPFLYYIDPDIPHNQGCIDHVEVIAPEGTICNARYPASTSCATIVPSDLMQDVVNRAMVEAMPDRVPAGGTRCQNLAQFSGEDGHDGGPWGFLLMNNAGGFGAIRGYDAWPLCFTQAALGAMKIESIEQLELLYPVHVESWEVEPDSMGAGEWLGGPGNRIVVQPLSGVATVITYGDGCANPPHGALGGTPGIGGGQYVDERATGSRRYVSGSGNMRVDSASEAWVGVSTGGGGFGLPYDRSAEAVRRDVRDGVVSRSAAREVFGVALSEDRDPAVLEEETQALRDALRGAGRPMLDPTTPGASTWLAGEMREGDVYLLNPL